MTTDPHAPRAVTVREWMYLAHAPQETGEDHPAKPDGEGDEATAAKDDAAAE